MEPTGKYLTGDALTAARNWLHTHHTPTPDDTKAVEALIETTYPGGLHFFICTHLTTQP